MSALPSTYVPRGAQPSHDGRLFTDWRKGTPTLRGVYPTRVASPLYPGGYWYGFSRWNGKRWHAGRKNPDAAATVRAVGAQNKEYRGLAREPR